MTTDTVPQTVLFPDLFDKPLFAKFNQEQASSDGGAGPAQGGRARVRVGQGVRPVPERHFAFRVRPAAGAAAVTAAAGAHGSVQGRS